MYKNQLIYFIYILYNNTLLWLFYDSLNPGQITMPKYLMPVVEKGLLY